MLSRQGSPPEEKSQTTTTATPPPNLNTSPGNTTPTTASTTATTLLLLLVVLALFPTLFHLLWTLPLRLLLPSPHPHQQHNPPGAIIPRTGETMWSQKHFTLPARARGSYLITDTVLKELPEIRSYKVGLLNLFIQHTSCALSLNENWDEVRFFFSLPRELAAWAVGRLSVRVCVCVCRMSGPT